MIRCRTLTRRAAVAVAMIASLSGAAQELIAPSVSALTLRPAVLCGDEPATMALVLDFSNADAELLAAIGDKPISAGGAVREVSHEQIVVRLRELGVNLARVTVSGALSCKIEVAASLAQSAEAATPAAEPIVREPAADVTQSLADIIRKQVSDSLAGLNGDADVRFEAAGKEFLALTAPPFEFSVRGPRGPALGVQEFSVTIRRDGRTQRSVRIGVDSSVTRRVVVAAKPLNVGAFIRPENLELAPRTFSSVEDLGIEHVDRLVGQQVAEFVPAGQMIRTRDIKSVDLVKRSQAVSVVSDGAVGLRLTGTALDSGGYGETVRVAVGDKKSRRRELRGTVVGVATVRLMEDGL